MTPDELNAIVEKLADKVGGEVLTRANNEGQEPEIGVEIDDVAIVLTVMPV